MRTNLDKNDFLKADCFAFNHLILFKFDLLIALSKWSIPGVGNLGPAGRIPPTEHSYQARHL